MFKAIILAAALAVAQAGFLGSPTALHAGPVATYAAAAPIAHYSSAPAVSSSYFHQAHAPAVHAVPAVAAVHAAPAYAAVHAAPAVATVHAAPLAYHTPSVGASHESVFRSLGGNQAVSHYSKAVDSAFSSVRKYDTRITNDALAVAPVAAYAHAAPVAYAHHAAPIGYAHHAAPVGYAHHAPITTYAAHTPVIAKTAAVAYSPAAVVSHVTFTGMGANYAW